MRQNRRVFLSILNFLLSEKQIIKKRRVRPKKSLIKAMSKDENPLLFIVVAISPRVPQKKAEIPT